MEAIAKQQGFMFWNFSAECEAWLLTKSSRDKEIISALAFTQR